MSCFFLTHSVDDKIDVGIVRLLAFWYSNQQACVRWHDNVSAFFTLGTRQGGVLSPWFFARYVKNMLAHDRLQCWWHVCQHTSLCR